QTAPASRSETATHTHCPGIHLSRPRRSRPRIPRENYSATARSPTRNNLGLLDRFSLQFRVAFRPASQFRSRDPLFSRAKYVPEKPDNSRVPDGIGRCRRAGRDKPFPASLPKVKAPVVRSRSRSPGSRKTTDTTEPDQEYPTTHAT